MIKKKKKKKKEKKRKENIKIYIILLINLIIKKIFWIFNFCQNRYCLGDYFNSNNYVESIMHWHSHGVRTMKFTADGMKIIFSINIIINLLTLL